MDTDGTRHTAKLAWRALAMLQLEMEAEQAVIKVSPVVVRDPVGDFMAAQLPAHLAEHLRGASFTECDYPACAPPADE